MRILILGLAVFTSAALAVALSSGPEPARAAAAAARSFEVDGVHSSVVFEIRYQGIASFFGRFDKVSGSFEIDEADLSKSTFEVSIDAESVHSGNPQRDGHLRNTDFFNAKKHPQVIFKSTKVAKKGEKELEVTGDMILRGETKSVTAKVVYGGTIDDAHAGKRRAGLDGTLVIRRKDFGMDFALDALGDEVTIRIGLTGLAKS
jgi:polyisoprenoid-binding protein YceI